MTDPRAAYLADLAVMLSGSVGAAGAGAPTDPTTVLRSSRYVVVPSAAKPRVLVPAGEPRAAAAAIRYSVEAASPAARRRREVLAAAFRAGVGERICRDRLPEVSTVDGPALDEHLGEVLGQPVLLGVHIGPPRANRKPVLVLLDDRGTVLGFAKLGVNELTRELVDAEAAALGELAKADLGPVTVPVVRHHGTWGEHTLLVQAALPVWLPRATPSATEGAEEAALVTLAGCLGLRPAPYPGSSYEARLRAGVAALEQAADAARLDAVLTTLAGRADVLPFGCWHGDWNGTNNAVLADRRVLVWDWERFEADVPAGFDALHLTLQGAITRRGVPPWEAVGDLFAGAPELLAPFGVPAGSADLVTALYLVHLGTRYLHDRQAEAGARLGRVAEWLLPALEEQLPAVERGNA